MQEIRTPNQQLLDFLLNETINTLATMNPNLHCPFLELKEKLLEAIVQMQLYRLKENDYFTLTNGHEVYHPIVLHA